MVAILNDTTGCLMSTAWREPKCRIGLILGTGTNACYLEDVQVVFTNFKTPLCIVVAQITKYYFPALILSTWSLAVKFLLIFCSGKHFPFNDLMILRR